MSICIPVFLYSMRQAIGKYVSLHPHNLAQKTEIIIEHFRSIVSKKIGGKAKAMVVFCSGFITAIDKINRINL